MDEMDGNDGNGTAQEISEANNKPLDVLYKQLKDIESMEERLDEDKSWSVESQRVLPRLENGHVMRDDKGEVKWEGHEHRIPEMLEALKRQEETIMLLIPMLDNYRNTLRKEVNICSRSTIRSLTILDLPDEILGQIFDYVKGPRVYHIDHYPPRTPQSDGTVRNLRLTCRRFCNASSHLLVHLLRLRVDNQSLSLLEKVSLHPRISKGVDTIFLDLRFYHTRMAQDFLYFGLYYMEQLRRAFDIHESLLAPAFNFGGEGIESHQQGERFLEILQSWQDSLQGTTEDDLIDTTILLEETLRKMPEDKKSQDLLILRKAHGIYQHAFSEQQELLNNNKFIHTFSNALSRMPNASRLEISCDGESMKRSHLHRFNGAKDHATLFQWIVKFWSSEDAWMAGLQAPAPGSMLQMPIALPISIHKAGSHLTKLCITISSPEDWSCLSMNQIELSGLRAAARKLQTFEFHLEYQGRSDTKHWRTELEWNHLQTYLGAIINTDTLETLSLQFPSYSFAVMTPSFSMSALISSPSWPRLRRLRLRGMALHLTELQNFTDRLRRVPVADLENFYLLSGTWAEALDVLRAKSRCLLHWGLASPHGAECDDLSYVDIGRVFEKPRNKTYDFEKLSLAEKYIRGWSDSNPLRGLDIVVPPAEATEG